MERMWSPWRSELLKQERFTLSADEGEQSLFSRLVSEQKDEENLILWRGKHVFVIMNAFPYNNGHLMIVPYREVALYEALTRDEQVEIAVAIDHCIQWLRIALKPEGFNVGMNLGKAAGAGLPRHMHVHVVPRWAGDTNFMPAIGDIKIIPEAIRDTYDALRNAIASYFAQP
jgi:ATP adenylyltransferase